MLAAGEQKIVESPAVTGRGSLAPDASDETAVTAKPFPDPAGYPPAPGQWHGLVLTECGAKALDLGG